MKEERVIWQGSPSAVKLTGHFIFTVILSAVIIAGAFLSGMLLILAFLIIPIGYAAWKLIELKSNHFEVTNERIRISTGIFNKQTEDLELYRVKDFKMVQPLFLRMFSLSNIHLSTSDKSSNEVVIEAVNNGRALCDDIRAAVEDRRDKKRVSEIDFQ